MIPLSEKFRDRAVSLFQSQKSRGREKRTKNGRILKPGYTLPFDCKQFTAWLLDRFGGENGAIPCRYCRRPIDVYSCQLDHGTPLSRSGSPGLGNLDPTCPPCNDVKGKMLPEEMDFFLAKMVDMGNRFHNGIAVKDITHRLESYSAMKATVNRTRATQQKQAAAAMSAHDDNF